jgi:predicted esterase
MRKPPPQLEQRHEFTVRLPVEIAESRPPAPTELIVLLHGYEESGDRILGKLAPALPPGAWVVAPNGPFPLPRKVGDGYKLGFAWYFYVSARGEYYIDMELSIGIIDTLIRELGAEALPKRVIGFSQGGYLAPFVGQRLRNTRQVVGLACDFLHEELGLLAPLPFPVDGLCGSADKIISPEEARRTFEALTPHCRVAGRFEALLNSEHKIDDAFVEGLKRRIAARPIG